MGCEVEDLGRQRERPSACQHSTDPCLSLSLSLSPSFTVSLNLSDTRTHRDGVQTHHSGQER